MNKYEAWLDKIEEGINDAWEVQADKVKPLGEIENVYPTSHNAHKIQKLVENGEPELISKEFVKTMCAFAIDVVAFSEKDTFKQMIHEINANQIRISGMNQEELAEFENNEGIGVSAGLNWLFLSFIKKYGLYDKLTKDISFKKAILWGIAHAISEYLDTIKPQGGEE